MATKTADPHTPAIKPHETTADQIDEMQSEGQAQTPGNPAPVESPEADCTQGASEREPIPDPDEAAAGKSDQDIDTAGTEADTERLATGNPTGRSNDRNGEIQGDSNSGDIVGPTGEQMPRQSHDGLEADSRGRNRQDATRAH